MGLTVEALANELVRLGIGDAVMGDGSDSATLVIDGNVEVRPGEWRKNRAIPVGLMLRRADLRVVRPSRSICTSSTDNRVSVGSVFESPRGVFSLNGQWLEFQLDSLGRRRSASPSSPSQFWRTLWQGIVSRFQSTVLEVQLGLPAGLAAPSARLEAGTVLSGANSARLTVAKYYPTLDGAAMEGGLDITSSQGDITLNIDWEVKSTPRP
jgi:hypothetical protein